MKWYSKAAWKLIPPADQKALCAKYYPCGTPPPVVDPPPDSEEYIYRAGHVVRVPVAIEGGKLVGDFYVPEAGRTNDAWAKSNFFGIFDSMGNCYEFRAFKIKACAVTGDNPGCHEPRYNLKWDIYRHVTATWNATEFVVNIDGTTVKADRPTNWVGPFTLRYGDDGHLMVGGKNKNLTITKWE